MGSDNMKTEYVPCNICNTDETVVWAKKDGRTIVQCKNCGLVYTNPRPVSEELQRFYSNDYFTGGNYDGDILRKKMYDIEINTQLSKIAGSTGNFLDVGCAYGAFLNSLPGTFHKYGIEFSEDAAQYGLKKSNLRIETGQIRHSKYRDNFFDIIHFRGVIEHLQNPMEDIMASSRLLKPDGYLIISTTPNIASPVARRFRERFRLVMPGEHIYYFSPKTLALLLNKAGFKVKKTFYPYLNTPYANLWSDLASFFINRREGKDSPPFFRSVMTVYAKKA